MSNNLFTRLQKRFQRKRFSAVPADQFFIAGEPISGMRDRPSGNFRGIIERSLQAWREDPLARRIVCLTTQFSIGRGFRFSADHPESESILREFWDHPLNHMDARLTEWSDELCRTGNLFIQLSSDISGMTYVRAVPAVRIEEIIPQPNDIEQAAAFRVKEYSALSGNYQVPKLTEILPASLTEPVNDVRMLHFTINRPIGGQWGEPDLSPLLVWLDRYRVWMEDRARLNHYRTAFLYMVKSPFTSEAQRVQRQAQLNLRPPTPGMILVTGNEEEWSVLHPDLDSGNANEDGMAIKKLIAAGAGIPISFLAEPGSSSKAESGGMEDSACRNFRQRQQTLLYITETVLRHVLARAALVRKEADPDCEIHIYGENIAVPGISEGGMIH